MRWITLILFLASCSEKEQDALLLQDVDTVMIKSEQRTKAIVKQLDKVDLEIHEQEQRIEHDLKDLKSEIQDLKVTQKSTKVIYIHDTIVIKEKTNFWGKKRISVDSSNSVDSLEYN